MKKLLFLLTILGLNSCIGSQDEPTPLTVYEPVIIDRHQMEASIKVENRRDISHAGKIYYKDNYLFITEKYRGIHLIDNTNPSSPINKGFIKILGIQDIAIKKDVLYADNATDLIAIDISNLQNPQVSFRNRDIFPELPPPDGGRVPSTYSKGQRPKNTLIVDWIKK